MNSLFFQLLYGRRLVIDRRTINSSDTTVLPHLIPRPKLQISAPFGVNADQVHAIRGDVHFELL